MFVNVKSVVKSGIIFGFMLALFVAFGAEKVDAASSIVTVDKVTAEPKGNTTVLTVKNGNIQPNAPTGTETSEENDQTPLHWSNQLFSRIGLDQMDVSQTVNYKNTVALFKKIGLSYMELEVESGYKMTRTDIAKMLSLSATNNFYGQLSEEEIRTYYLYAVLAAEINADTAANTEVTIAELRLLAYSLVK